MKLIESKISKTVKKLALDYYDELTLRHINQVASYFIEGSELWIVAMLHDICEDTDLTLRELKAKLPPEYRYLVLAVDSISRKKEDTYFYYIENLVGFALVVKAADLYVNRIVNEKSLSLSLQKRYDKAIAIIGNRLVKIYPKTWFKLLKKTDIKDEFYTVLNYFEKF